MGELVIGFLGGILKMGVDSGGWGGRELAFFLLFPG